MSKLSYFIDLTALVGCEDYQEASKHELRVLISLIALKGECGSVDALAKHADVSISRCKAALELWKSAGIIKERCSDGIVEEFEERLERGEIDEEPARCVADTIRNENLAGLFEELSMLMEKPSLPTADVKLISGLVSQYQLDADYILTLAAYMNTKGNLTARKLCNKAISLSDSDIDNVFALEEYINNCSHSAANEWEMRRIFGIYNRSLGDSEREFFNRWVDQLDYSTSVIRAAYDIAVISAANGRADMRYIDRILQNWHDGGCRTVEECRAYSQKNKPVAQTAGSSKSHAKSQAQTPRYGDFDVFAAFDDAVERSFGCVKEEGDN